MEDSNKEDILVMALFVVTRETVLACAGEMGKGESAITADIYDEIKGKVGNVLGNWRKEVKKIIKETIGTKPQGDTGRICPLGMDCTSSCVFGQAGNCGVWEELLSEEDR
jgi:hypothetical protein